MGQDPSADGASVTDTREPAEIRSEIELTRQQLGETVASLARKTDVKAQARYKVEETKASVSHKKDELLGKAREASPERAASLASRGSARARENPLPLAAAGAFTAGFLLAGIIVRKREVRA